MKLFAIKNRAGQTLGTFRRTDKKYALQAFMDGQAQYAAVFKNTSIVQRNEVTVVEIKENML